MSIDNSWLDYHVGKSKGSTSTVGVTFKKSYLPNGETKVLIDEGKEKKDEKSEEAETK